MCSEHTKNCSSQILQRMSMHTEKKRLTRSSADKVLAGVLGGIAEYYDLNPTWLRIGTALAGVFTSGVAVVVYLIIAVIMPNPNKAKPIR